MNKRIKEVIVAIQNSKIIYADTNINTFHQAMRILEPATPSKQTIKKHLDRRGFYYYTNEYGASFHVCKYENTNYIGLKK